jgi:hypothetical protein
MATPEVVVTALVGDRVPLEKGAELIVSVTDTFGLVTVLPALSSTVTTG